jgi:Pectate lyase superfamily protein
MSNYFRTCGFHNLMIGLLGALLSGNASAVDTTFPGSVYIQGPGPWFDVKAPPFSAVGDGLADDTAKIQMAIDAAVARGGGTVFFPPGRYRVVQSLKDRGARNLELRGAGNAGWGDSGSAPPFAAPGISSIVTNQPIWILDFGAAGASNPFGPHINALGFQDTNINNNPNTGNALGAIRITNEYHVQMQDVACADFRNGYCVRLNATVNDYVQYGSIIDLKSRNTKFAISGTGAMSQLVILGGHFSAPPSFIGSIGIDFEPLTPGANVADTIMIINPSIESFETGIKLIDTNGVRVMARIENTNAAFDHKGTGISVDGAPSNLQTGRTNIIMGTAIGRLNVGIDIRAGAKTTQIISNSVTDTLSKLNVDPAAADGTVIIGSDVVGAGTGTGGARWTTGAGYPYSNPLPSPACSTGSLYTRTDGGVGSTLYICEGTSGAASWRAK